MSAPADLCWRNDSLVIADAAQQRLVVLDAQGRFSHAIGRGPKASNRFVQLALLRCAESVKAATAYLVVDIGLDKLLLLDGAGRVVRELEAPHLPQLEAIGEFTLANDGRWFEAWLGSRLSIGPYLSESQWTTTRLVRRWSADGVQDTSFAEPVAYGNTVARRVLNRVYMTMHRDSLWLLRQGDAAIIGFDANGRPASPAVYLPVYHRGPEPSYIVKAPLVTGEEFRSNRMAYDPSVAGLAVIDDSLFAVIRYRDWRWRHVGTGIGSFARWPESSIEIVNRRGIVRRAIVVAGLAFEIASNGAGRLAILTRDAAGRRHVLMMTTRQ